MSTSLGPLLRCCQRSALLLVARRQSSSSSASPFTLLSRLLVVFAKRFYDAERLLSLMVDLERRRIWNKNSFYGYTQKLYGLKIASAFYILSMGGGFRYVGHSDWYRPNRWGKFSWDFLEHKDTSIEEVDMSYTLINYRGMTNLWTQHHLRTLKLRGCPEVDDWFLAGLHNFQDTLEELDISHCPLITTGGLAALRNLTALKRLNVSSLPKVSSPELVFILLEEMLPKCQITADNCDYSLMQQGVGDTGGQR
ncbi:distal membrane-arm assembly complex protein 2 [Kryptolebias marmoratus]|uniref:distal membrane-arm assembly complex protein 2 n=1 Tax=Kryptolebias marmoratus TaxID=37003 RepID=UPI0007F8EC90|nr:distal membrane-arm assembly complex protein 2 [Kryptolebias marmoratus]